MQYFNRKVHRTLFGIFVSAFLHFRKFFSRKIKKVPAGFICSFGGKLLFFGMSKTNKWIILFLLGILLGGSKAQEMPLVHVLPSGTTLLIAPSKDVDYVSIQLLIDKRPFKGNIRYLSFINAFLRNLEAGLSEFTGIVQLYPFGFIPESPYNFKEQGYLIFKTSSIYFDQNLSELLKAILGRKEFNKIFLYDKNKILLNLSSQLHAFPLDSIKRMTRWSFNRDFKKFLKDSTLKQHMILYVSGNVNVYRVVAQALAIQRGMRRDVAPSRNVDSFQRQNTKDMYWYLAFRLFVLDRLKALIGQRIRTGNLRLYMPVQNGAQFSSLWMTRDGKDFPLNRVMLEQISSRFATLFRSWYRLHYVTHLNWIYNDDDQKGFYRLLAFMETQNPDMPFQIATDLDMKQLRIKFTDFIHHIRIGRPGSDQ